MSLTLDQITEEAMRLPASSRVVLADKLTESLEFEELNEIQGLWSKEAIVGGTRFAPAWSSHFQAKKCLMKFAAW